ncbi:TPM domain-containing protein, partial [Sandarakinorhabdus rubra]|uniref:TPM domain-containing protein n=1 Tax=Sandarakinorhabdus rubra TaxID=2672568 RepID=UPI0013DA8889
LLAVLQLAVPAQAAPTYPPLTGRVTDAAGVLTPEAAAALEGRLKALEDQGGTQLVVATVASLEGYEIEDYGVGLLRHWGIGQKDVNNGAILLVAPTERKVRIEVGYGLEGVLTDAMSSQIIRRDIIPRFKAGDMAGGITAGADRLITLLALPPDQQKQAVAAAQASTESRADSDGVSIIKVIFWVIVILWLIGATGGGGGGRGRRRGPVIIWGPGMGGSWSG